MESEEIKEVNPIVSKPNPSKSTNVVAAEASTVEEVPTLPLGSLEEVQELQPAISVHSIAPTQQVSMPAPLVVPPAEYHRGLGEWLQIMKDGVRPNYLPLSLIPVLLGSTLAWTQTISPSAPIGQFRLTPFIATIVAVLLMQIGAHLINDYYDYIYGVDTSNPLGPGGLIQQGLIRPRRILTLGIVLLVLGAFVGLILAASGRPLLLLFGLLGILCAFFYSATPWSLSSLTLGDAVAFVIFGPLLTLSAYFVQTGQLSPLPFTFSLSLGLLAAATLHVNNMRDAESDAHAGKRTIASILGLGWSRVWFFALLVGAYAIIVALGVPPKAPHLVLITLWTFPTLLIVVTGILRTDTPSSQHIIVQQMLKLFTSFGILLAVAFIANAYWIYIVQLNIKIPFLP